jgi:phosphoglycolate phosphatase
LTTPQGILFDKDGTLFDFHATWGAWAQGLLTELAAGDAARAVALGDAVGFDLATDGGQGSFRPESPVIAGTPDQIAAILLRELPEWQAGPLVTLMNDRAARAPQAEAVPLRPLLTLLRGLGLRLGVMTNDAEAPARAHLAAAGVSDLFDMVIGCDSGHGAKPDPAPLLAFAHAMALDPAAVVMVGDSRHDLHAGRAAGMATVGVLTGLAKTPDLAPLADAVLADIGYLPGWLAGRSADRDAPQAD